MQKAGSIDSISLMSVNRFEPGVYPRFGCHTGATRCDPLDRPRAPAILAALRQLFGELGRRHFLAPICVLAGPEGREITGAKAFGFGTQWRHGGSGEGKMRRKLVSIVNIN
jgi:hypothetical protein